MKIFVVAITALALTAGQATSALAQTNQAQVARASLVNSCSARVKPTKMSKSVVVQNRCEFKGIDHVGAVPLVFGGAIIAGVVAIALTNNNNDNNSTSP